jgi:hypothetical protein
MKNAALRAVTPCGSCKNRRFGGMYRLHHQGEKIGELVITSAVISNRSTLRRNTIYIKYIYIIYVLYIKVVFLRAVLRLLVTANVVPSLQSVVTLMMEAIRP